MDSRPGGLICNLHFGVGQRLPCWIPDDADDAARTRGLGHEQRRDEQKAHSCKQPGKTANAVEVQDRKPTLPNLHRTSFISSPSKLGS